MTAAAPRRPFISSGTLVILSIGMVLLIGWFAYQPYIPPMWLHDLSADIALRAEADPNPALPEDARQASPRGLADSPYICVAKVVHKSWDHIYAVTPGQDLRSHPALSAAVWPKKDLDATVAEMARDKRYQLLVLTKDNTVVDAQLFYTFWGNLDAIARPEGFSSAEAIFTAASQNGVYVVTPAADPPTDVCR